MTAAPANNPFHNWTDAEYELFISTVRAEVVAGAKEAIQQTITLTCNQHHARTENLETAMFGRFERGIAGVDHRLLELERQVKDVEEIRQDMAELKTDMKGVKDALEQQQEGRMWLKRELTRAVVVLIFSVMATVIAAVMLTALALK